MGSKFKEGNKIYLFRKNIKIKRLSNKLNYKKLRLFKINKKVRSINYKLKLLETIKIYLVFYILLLELVSPNISIVLVTKVQ
jgi:hypothetical protein